MGDQWKVGDQVIVRRAGYGRSSGQVDTAVVTRVARKYFYIDGGWHEQAFEIATGREKSNGYSYADQAYTPEGWEAKQFRDGVLEKIREHKVSWGYEGSWRERDWSTGHLCELLTLLEKVKTEQEA